jgi:hypothetical protein
MISQIISFYHRARIITITVSISSHISNEQIFISREINLFTRYDTLEYNLLKV